MLHQGVYCSYHCCSPNAVTASLDDTHGGSAHGSGVGSTCFDGMGNECGMIDFIVDTHALQSRVNWRKSNCKLDQQDIKMGAQMGGTELTLLY